VGICADATNCVTCVGAVLDDRLGDVIAEVAVMQLDIDAQPLGAHGASHDLLDPAVPQPFIGMAGDWSCMAIVEACVPCWLECCADGTPCRAFV
jgi:hypothetical protein